MQAILSALRSHKAALVGALVGVLVVGFYVFGCASRTQSLSDPSKRVTAAQLQMEAVQKQADLDRQADQIAKDQADAAAQLNALAATLKSKLDQESADYDNQVKAIDAGLQARKSDLANQDAQKVQILQSVGSLAGSAITGLATGGFDPVKLYTGVVGLLVGGGLATAAGGAVLSNLSITKKLPTPWDGSTERRAVAGVAPASLPAAPPAGLPAPSAPPVSAAAPWDSKPAA